MSEFTSSQNLAQSGAGVQTVTATANGTVRSGISVVLSTAAEAATVMLPDPAQHPGRHIAVVGTGAGDVTVEATDGVIIGIDTIDSDVQSALLFVSSGVDWFSIPGFIA